MSFWLLKSEPDVFGIDDLKARRTEPWDGVRNYQARNFIRRMQPGDLGFLYHSNCEVPGIHGLLEIASAPFADATQFDRKSKYHDAASRREEPRWSAVDVRYRRHLKRPITLAELRTHEKALRGLRLLARGNRLSVMPVTPAHWEYILKLERK